MFLIDMDWQPRLLLRLLFCVLVRMGCSFEKYLDFFVDFGVERAKTEKDGGII